MTTNTIGTSFTAFFNSIDAALSGSVTDKLATICDKIASIWVASSTNIGPYAGPVAFIVAGSIIVGALSVLLKNRTGAIACIALTAFAGYNAFLGKLYI